MMRMAVPVVVVVVVGVGVGVMVMPLSLVGLMRASAVRARLMGLVSSLTSLSLLRTM